MTTINNARAIFLMELRENTYIDISAHLFSILADVTKATSRPKLILPSLIRRILHEKSVETPQDISLLPTPPAINALTITRSKVRLPGDEEEVDPTQEQPWKLRLKQKDIHLHLKGLVVEQGAEPYHPQQSLLMHFRLFLRGSTT